ncbi:hypothetical protein [Occultella kanbiaonis]|uniref:hypothetical protein n=1 Tax=Occultella kanbiaonis TaxID=2675754 RepID=UPI0013D6E422|nr:hypothetical protein [Occultella kanbiaonis]
MLDGWDVWTQLTEEDHAAPALYQSVLLANGPNGEMLTFGMTVTGSLTSCGGYAYWYHDEPSDDIDGATEHLLRWQPGMDHAELIDVSDEATHAGGTWCADGILSTSQTTDTEGVTSTSFYER